MAAPYLMLPYIHICTVSFGILGTYRLFTSHHITQDIPEVLTSFTN